MSDFSPSDSGMERADANANLARSETLRAQEEATLDFAEDLTRLRAAIVRATTSPDYPVLSEATLSGLRASVTRFVLLLRRANAPPERTIVIAKSVVAATLALELRRPVLMEKVVRWVIETYYSAPE